MEAFNRVIKEHSNLAATVIIKMLEASIMVIGKAKPFGIDKSGRLTGFDQLLLLEGKLKDALSLADAIKERTE